MHHEPEECRKGFHFIFYDQIMLLTLEQFL